MIDFHPAPKLNLDGPLNRKKATPQEITGEELFFGRVRCSACHIPPFYTDHQMHDLHLERFGAESVGLIKTFVLQGVKDTPPYLHDGRLPTLEDTVEFFDVVLGLKLRSAITRPLLFSLRRPDRTPILRENPQGRSFDPPISALVASMAPMTR